MIPLHSVQAWASSVPLAIRTPTRILTPGIPSRSARSWIARDRTRHLPRTTPSRAVRSTAFPMLRIFDRSAGSGSNWVLRGLAISRYNCPNGRPRTVRVARTTANWARAKRIQPDGPDRTNFRTRVTTVPRLKPDCLIRCGTSTSLRVAGERSPFQVFTSALPHPRPRQTLA